VRVTVVSDPHRLLVADAKIDSDDRSLAASLQLAKPLVGHIIVPGQRNGEDAAGKIPSALAETTDPVAPYHGDSRFRCEMNAHRHDVYDTLFYGGVWHRRLTHDLAFREERGSAPTTESGFAAAEA
jgi:hypothetical protein